VCCTEGRQGQNQEHSGFGCSERPMPSRRPIRKGGGLSPAFLMAFLASRRPLYQSRMAPGTHFQQIWATLPPGTEPRSKSSILGWGPASWVGIPFEIVDVGVVLGPRNGIKKGLKQG
jgi:hypothetical protein